MTTIRELRDREMVLCSLRQGIDTSNATGRMVAGVLASLAELELELGRERRAAAREARRPRGQHIGRPKALDKSKAELARRMHGSGEPVSTIAAMLHVSRATVYRVLAQCRLALRPRKEAVQKPSQTLGMSSEYPESHRFGGRGQFSFDSYPVVPQAETGSER